MTASTHNGLFGRPGYAVRRLVSGGFPMRLALAMTGVARDTAAVVGMVLNIVGRLAMASAADFLNRLRLYRTGSGQKKKGRRQKGKSQPILRIILRFNSPKLRTPDSAMASFSSMLSSVSTRSTPGCPPTAKPHNGARPMSTA